MDQNYVLEEEEEKLDDLVPVGNQGRANGGDKTVISFSSSRMDDSQAPASHIGENRAASSRMDENQVPSQGEDFPSQKAIDTLTDEEKVTLYEHILKMGRAKYDHERAREESLIRQASNLQLVYVLLLGVLFVITKLLMEYCSADFSPLFYLVGALVIALPTIAGIILTSCAQYRNFRRRKQNVQSLNMKVLAEHARFLKKSERLKSEIDQIIDQEGPLSQTNNARVGCIHAAIILLYVSFALTIIMIITALVLSF